LADELARTLMNVSRRTRRSRSEIVRLALQEFLGTLAGRRGAADRVRDLIGSPGSGIPDLARKRAERAEALIDVQKNIAALLGAPISERS
jgi:Ribbon-helix-helix protein, copG family